MARPPPLSGSTSDSFKRPEQRVGVWMVENINHRIMGFTAKSRAVTTWPLLLEQRKSIILSSLLESRRRVDHFQVSFMYLMSNYTDVRPTLSKRPSPCASQFAGVFTLSREQVTKNAATAGRRDHLLRDGLWNKSVSTLARAWSCLSCPPSLHGWAVAGTASVTGHPEPVTVSTRRTHQGTGRNLCPPRVSRGALRKPTPGKPSVG